MFSIELNPNVVSSRLGEDFGNNFTDKISVPALNPEFELKIIPPEDKKLSFDFKNVSICVLLSSFNVRIFETKFINRFLDETESSVDSEIGAYRYIVKPDVDESVIRGLFATAEERYRRLTSISVPLSMIENSLGSNDGVECQMFVVASNGMVFCRNFKLTKISL